MILNSLKRGQEDGASGLLGKAGKDEPDYTGE
jgi:hypothetical protein